MFRQRLHVPTSMRYPSVVFALRGAASSSPPDQSGRDSKTGGGILYNKFSPQATAEREEKGVRDYTMVRLKPKELSGERKEFYDYFIDDTGTGYTPSHKRTGVTHPISAAFSSKRGVSADKRDRFNTSLKSAANTPPSSGPWVDVTLTLRKHEFVTELIPMPSDLPHLVPGEALVLDLNQSRESRRPYILELEDESLVMPVFSVDAHAAVYFQKLEINDAFWFPFPRTGSQRENFDKMPQPVLGCASFTEMARMATMAAPGRRLGIVINPFTPFTKFLTYTEMMNVAMAKDAEGNVVQASDHFLKAFNTKKWKGKRHDPISLIRNKALHERAGFGPAAIARIDPEKSYQSEFRTTQAGATSDPASILSTTPTKGGFAKKDLDLKHAMGGFQAPQDEKVLAMKRDAEQIHKERERHMARSQERLVNAMGKAVTAASLAQRTSSYVARPGDADLDDDPEFGATSLQQEGDPLVAAQLKRLMRVPEIAQLELKLLMFDVPTVKTIFISCQQAALWKQWVKGSQKYQTLVTVVVEEPKKEGGETHEERKTKVAELLSARLAAWTFLEEGGRNFDLKLRFDSPTAEELQGGSEHVQKMKEIYSGSSSIVQRLRSSEYKTSGKLVVIDIGFDDDFEGENSDLDADYTPKYASSTNQTRSIFSGKVPRRSS